MFKRPDKPDLSARRSFRLAALSAFAVSAGFHPAHGTQAVTMAIPTIPEISIVAPAQTAPNAAELAAYRGLLGAAAKGDVAQIKKLIAGGADVNVRDGHGRTPLIVAAHRKDQAAARALIAAGADVNALDKNRYDVITVSAVLDDVEMIKLAIASGANTGLITSPYDGTALIAAAHLGHIGVVKTLIAGKAPLDHVNNLGWTALIEAIVLGDGGARHVACLRALVDAGADVNLADSNGVRPLTLARQRGYQKMATILERAGARP